MIPGHRDVVEGARRQDVGVQAAQGRQVPRRQRAHGRGRRVLDRPRRRRSRTARARSSRTRRRSSAKEIVDPYTIRFKTAAPHPLMPNDLSTIYIVVEEGRDRRDDRGLQLRQGDDRQRPLQVRALRERRPRRARRATTTTGARSPPTRRSRSRSSRTSRRASRRCCPATSTRSSSRRRPTSRASSPIRSSR